MNFLDKKIDIRTVLISLLFIQTLTIFIAFIFLGLSTFINEISILLLFFQAFLFFYYIKFNHDKYNLILSLLIFFIIFFYPRILQYFLIPRYIFFPYPEYITAVEFNKLLFLTITTILILFFLTKIFEYKNFQLNQKKISDFYLNINLKSLLLIIITIIFFEIFLIEVIELNYSSSISTNKYHYVIMFFRNLFGGDIFFILILTIIFRSKINHKWKLYFFLHLIYLILMTYQGSKGAILRNDFILIFHLIFFQNFKFKLKYIILFFVINLVISPPLYLANELVRKNNAIGDFDKIKDIKVDELKTETYVYNLENTLSNKRINSKLSFNMSKKYFNSEFYKDSLLKINPLSKLLNRLGVIDYSLLILKATRSDNLKERPHITQEYNFSSLFKRIINQTLPGNLFINHELSESRLLPNLVKNYSKESIKKFFNTEPTTVWGSVVTYGKGNINISVLFLITFYLVSFLSMFIVSRYFGYYSEIFVFIVFITNFFGSYGMYGIDGHFVKLIIIYIQCMSFLLLYFILNKIFKNET